MGQACVMGATLQCSFGAAPSSLMVLPTSRVSAAGMPAANIMDSKPMLNILPFGMCMSLSNPTVASATAAALGVLTPMPCVPMTTAPWAPGSSTVMVGPMPALTMNSKAMCNWGGVVSIVAPAQATVNVP